MLKTDERLLSIWLVPVRNDFFMVPKSYTSLGKLSGAVDNHFLLIGYKAMTNVRSAFLHPYSDTFQEGPGGQLSDGN